MFSDALRRQILDVDRTSQHQLIFEAIYSRQVLLGTCVRSELVWGRLPTLKLLNNVICYWSTNQKWWYSLRNDVSLLKSLFKYISRYMWYLFCKAVRGRVSLSTSNQGEVINHDQKAIHELFQETWI